MSPHPITPALLTGEHLLRTRAAMVVQAPTGVEIAPAAGRPAKNIGRELGQLQAAGLLDDRYNLTDDGRAALAALDRAASPPSSSAAIGQGPSPSSSAAIGQETQGGGLVYIPPALLDDNPLNPRKSYDAEGLEGLADTIEADGQVIEPLIVSPAMADGRRIVFAGHRRKRAALIVEGRFAARGDDLPPGLAQGVPCIERAASPAESLFIAVVENGQREGLAPWEDAQGLAALQAETGWSGRELARRTGRWRPTEDDPERGVRDVQEKIKVAREAPADLVEAHEQGLLTWEQFRAALRNGRVPAAGPASDPDYVRPLNVGLAIPPAPMAAAPLAAPASDDDATPALFDDPPPPALTPRQWVILTELAAHISTSPDTVTTGDQDGVISYVPVGKYWLDLDAVALQKDGLIGFKHQGRPHAFLTKAGLERVDDSCTDPRVIVWVEPRRVEWARAGFDPEDRDPSALRPFWIDWLNPEPVADAAPAQDDPAPAEAEPPHPDDVAAEAVLADVSALLAEGPPSDPTRFRALLERTHAWLPDGLGAAVNEPGVVVDSNGIPFCVADQDGSHPDAIARARALLIAVALNMACGLYGPEGN